MIETQPLEITDFTGGVTDYFLDGQPTQAQVMDNFFFTTHRKIQTRWGSDLFIDSQIPLGLFRVQIMEFLKDTKLDTDTFLGFVERRAYYDNSGAYAELTGPGGGPVFDQGGANSLVTLSEYQSLLFASNTDFSSVQKIYIDENNAIQLRNAGLPEIPSGVTVTPPPGSGASYSYAIVLRYQYQVGDTIYLDRGPVTFVSSLVTGGTITTGNGAVVNLPTTFATPENWDFANIEVEIYRTQDADSDYFLSGTVPFGTATYTDEVEDATLISQGALYGSNGAISNGTPPRCKYVHVVNGTGYYAHIQETSGAVNKYKILQSIPGDPDSVPPAFFEETEQEIFGVSSIYDRPMVFCRNYIYRIDNFINSAGNGSLDLRRIDDRAGCVSQNSIVQTHKGIFWAGEVGFYWSDGFKVLKISDNINETYKELVSNRERASRIHGTYDPNNERVIWSVCRNDGANEPDQCYVLDLRFGITATSSFTTISGGDSFKPTALKFHKDPQSQDLRVYRADTRGFVFYHQDGIFTDPQVDLTNNDPSTWISKAIIYDYKSCFIDFGQKFYRKIVPRILVSADNTTNLSLAIKSSNDNNRIVGDLKPIRYKQNITWGDSLPLWGDSEAIWNLQGIIEEWRRFPAKSLRCQYKQVQFTNAEVQILTSDLLGEVTVDPVLKTAVVSGSAQFPADIENYFIQLEHDNYTEKFLITSRAPTTVVLEDNDSSLPPAGSYKFCMVGIPKQEILVLNGYVLHYSPLSKSHIPFSAASLGGKPS